MAGLDQIALTIRDIDCEFDGVGDTGHVGGWSGRANRQGLRSEILRLIF